MTKTHFVAITRLGVLVTITRVPWPLVRENEVKALTLFIPSDDAGFSTAQLAPRGTRPFSHVPLHLLYLLFCPSQYTLFLPRAHALSLLFCPSQYRLFLSRIPCSTRSFTRVYLAVHALSPMYTSHYALFHPVYLAVHTCSSTRRTCLFPHGPPHYITSQLQRVSQTLLLSTCRLDKRMRVFQKVRVPCVRYREDTP